MNEHSEKKGQISNIVRTFVSEPPSLHFFFLYPLPLKVKEVFYLFIFVNSNV